VEGGYGFVINKVSWHMKHYCCAGPAPNMLRGVVCFHHHVGCTGGLCVQLGETVDSRPNRPAFDWSGAAHLHYAHANAPVHSCNASYTAPFTSNVPRCSAAPLYFKAIGGAVVRAIPSHMHEIHVQQLPGTAEAQGGQSSMECLSAGVLLQGFTLGYESVDSLIVLDTPDAVKAFTTTSFSIDADVGLGVGKLAGQVTFTFFCYFLIHRSSLHIPVLLPLQQPS
jgi:Las17-binding protein actin regulator